jgi:molybdenum cofactor cytidylyltransferase
MGEIWAIILAAGESKRMGQPKLLLTINGSTMLENIINIAKESDIDNTLVVLGAYRELLGELIDKSSVKSCYNDNYKEGMLSSVKCGFRNLPSDFKAVLVFQGDQPLISAKTVNKLIEAFRTSGKGIIIPVFEKKRGHPVMIDRKYSDKIGKLNNNKGLRSLSYQFSDDVMEVKTDDPGILMDFDTYEEYKNQITQIQ